MIRRTFTIASALSAALFVTTAALWAWSSSKQLGPVHLASPTPTRYTELAVGGGRLAIASAEWLANPLAAAAKYPGYPYGAEVGGWKAIGLQWRQERMTLLRPADRTVMLALYRSRTFYTWLGWPQLLSAIIPVWWLIRKRKVRRQKPAGTCRVCGYDLRASTERCPECGQAISG